MPRVSVIWCVRAAMVGTLAAFALSLSTCRTPEKKTEVGRVLERRGDEIMVAGRLVHTGTPVVLWFDPGGYDAYRVERRFAPPDKAGWDIIKDALRTPNRYGVRGVDDETLERVRGGGWSLAEVQRRVDQFVLHYDVCGTSRQCFKVLHDLRGLSVHFMLDIDGTIYQTLDVKEKAWHATKANDRSVGIEIAHIGAYGGVEGSPLASWYAPDGAGPRITLPPWMGDGGVRTPGFVGRPARPEPISGRINGNSLVQFDFTPEQYDALIRLTAALCTVLPEIACEYPRGDDGRVLDRVMTDGEFEGFRGLLGHWHVQDNKIDPGPAMDWERVVRGARELMQEHRARGR
jgi:N-acetyl-anhydromuramyl-L-alanine amidase AmpD